MGKPSAFGTSLREEEMKTGKKGGRGMGRREEERDGGREGKKHGLFVQFWERLGQAGRPYRTKAAAGMVASVLY